MSKGLGFKINVNAPCKSKSGRILSYLKHCEIKPITCNGISDDKGRRGQVVGTGVRMDSALKVAIARKDAAADQVALLDGLRYGLLKRARVANAVTMGPFSDFPIRIKPPLPGHAAIANNGETKRLKIGDDPRLPQVVGYNSRARRQTCLDVGSNGEAFLNRLLCHKACTKHHTIRRVW